LSKKFFCPHCGSAIVPEDKFCMNCGKTLITDTSKVQTQTLVQQQSQIYYAPVQSIPVATVIPKEAFLEYKAPYLDRFVALLIDGFIYDLCPPLWCFRDVIPERGKSFGKAILKLKVVDYVTGKPITPGQAFIRTMCLAFFPIIDLLVPLCNNEGRRIGDYVASTIVLEDR